MNVDRFINGAKERRQILDTIEAAGGTVEDIAYDDDGNLIVIVDLASIESIDAIDLSDLVDFELPDSDQN